MVCLGIIKRERILKAYTYRTKLRDDPTERLKTVYACGYSQALRKLFESYTSVAFTFSLVRVTQ